MAQFKPPKFTGAPQHAARGGIPPANADAATKAARSQAGRQAFRPQAKQERPAAVPKPASASNANAQSKPALEPITETVVAPVEVESNNAADCTPPSASHAPPVQAARKKLACDSTRKRRNRRKTICFGDWVTTTPPDEAKPSKRTAKPREIARAAPASGETTPQGLLATPAAPNAAPEPSFGSAIPAQTCARMTAIAARSPRVPKTPSHAEILAMSRALNAVAVSVLPGTPGGGLGKDASEEFSGQSAEDGKTLRERLAESWNGKSYYERLAAMADASLSSDAPGSDGVADSPIAVEDEDGRRSSSESTGQIARATALMARANAKRGPSTKTTMAQTKTPIATPALALSADVSDQLSDGEGSEGSWQPARRRKSYADVVATTPQDSLSLSHSCDSGASNLMDGSEGLGGPSNERESIGSGDAALTHAIAKSEELAAELASVKEAAAVAEARFGAEIAELTQRLAQEQRARVEEATAHEARAATLEQENGALRACLGRFRAMCEDAAELLE